MRRSPHRSEPEPYPRFVVGIDVPPCPHGCEGTARYYSDAYFAELAAPAIKATLEPAATHTANDTLGHI